MVETVIAGDSKSWSIKLCAIAPYRDAPRDLTVEAFLRTSAGALVSLDITNANGVLEVTLSPSVSEELPEGMAHLVLRATNEDLGYRRSAVIFAVDICPALDHERFDNRTLAQRMLSLAEAALEKYTQSGGRVRSYTIGSRQLTFSSAQEIIDLVNYWRNQVYLEQCAMSGKDPRKALVEFV